MRRSHEPLRGHRPIPSFRCSSRSHINAGSWLRHGHRHRAARIACPKQSKLYLSSRVRPRVDTSVFERGYVLKETRSPGAVRQRDNLCRDVTTDVIRLRLLSLPFGIFREIGAVTISLVERTYLLLKLGNINVGLFVFSLLIHISRTIS